MIESDTGQRWKTGRHGPVVYRVAIRGAGAAADVLLCGTAVSYALRARAWRGFRSGWVAGAIRRDRHEIRKLMESRRAGRRAAEESHRSGASRRAR